jgi:alkaline phosphatase D
MKRRKFIYQTSLGLGGLLPVVNQLKALEIGTGPYLTTGIKIGEITETEAIVWGRLTKALKPVGNEAPIPNYSYYDEKEGQWYDHQYFKKKYKEDRPDRITKVVFPEGYTVEQLEGAVPGSAGEMRLLFKKKGTRTWKEMSWMPVTNSTDFSGKFHLKNLQPGTEYDIKVEAKPIGGKTVSAFLNGRFATTVEKGSEKAVHFMVTTCHEYDHKDEPDGKGFKIYKHMQALSPDFLVHTGDVLYYDYKAKSVPLAYWHWQRMFGLTNCIDFYRQVPCYFMKDDHDTWMNDCYPQSKTRFMGELTFNEGVKIFREQVPMSAEQKPYRTFRWGKDLQIWVMEGREYRMDNTLPDGPEKTIWGKEQMAWFKDTFNASDATFRVLISATPIVGPDRPQKRDNHANSGFAHEGAMIREFLSQHKNVFVACGDRHWQYVSKDSKTGLMEFSCGPGSDQHASGWNKDDVLPEHQYLNIVGGFLGVEVKRESGEPTIRFTHYSVDGKKLFMKHFSREV